jgi:hypothetical protein
MMYLPTRARSVNEKRGHCPLLNTPFLLILPYSLLTKEGDRSGKGKIFEDLEREIMRKTPFIPSFNRLRTGSDEGGRPVRWSG